MVKQLVQRMCLYGQMHDCFVELCGVLRVDADNIGAVNIMAFAFKLVQGTRFAYQTYGDFLPFAS